MRSILGKWLTWQGKAANKSWVLLFTIIDYSLFLSLSLSTRQHSGRSSATSWASADMGPKNCASAMPLKDLSWIDRMYMKFETMCVEVDKNPSLLLQETSKYVESQVNAVGVNVKKLCTELIQDLISAPMLSSEGGEKKLECALHCKCHCMDSEKPKLVGTDIAGFRLGGDGLTDIAFQKQDNLEKELSKVEMLSVDSTTEPQNPKNSGVCCLNLKKFDEQDGIKDEETVSTAVVAFEMGESGKCDTFDEKLGLANGIVRCGEQQGDDCGKIEVICRNTENESKNEQSKMASGENVRAMEAVVYRGEARFAEQASRPEEDDAKTPLCNNGTIATHWCTEALMGSQGDNCKTQIEKQRENTAGLLEEQKSGIDLHNVIDRDIALNVDASHAKCKYDFFSRAQGSQEEEEEEEEAKRVGGIFWPMYIYHFDDLSRSTEEEDPVLVSDYDSERDVCDEEQSAYWFVGEDLKTALQPEIFSVEKSRHGECFPNDSDLDWELL